MVKTDPETSMKRLVARMGVAGLVLCAAASASACGGSDESAGDSATDDPSTSGIATGGAPSSGGGGSDALGSGGVMPGGGAGPGVGGSGAGGGNDGSGGAGQDADESLGCQGSAPLEAGDHALTVQARERRFRVELPTSYSSDSSWPLVLALHPNGGNVDYWQSSTIGRDLASEAGEEAIIVHLEAIDGQWRNYDLDPSEWPALLGEELTYVDEVITQVQAGLCVNLSEIFSLGFSGGGSFSGVLSCRRDDIRAFAAGGSVIYFDEQDCIGHSAAWIQIGEDDLSGREPYRDWFVARSNCDATTTPATPDSCVAYDGCDGDFPVIYCETPGLGHAVPDYFSAAAWGFLSSFVSP